MRKLYTYQKPFILKDGSITVRTVKHWKTIKGIKKKIDLPDDVLTLSLALYKKGYSAKAIYNDLMLKESGYSYYVFLNRLKENC